MNRSRNTLCRVCRSRDRKYRLVSYKISAGRNSLSGSSLQDFLIGMPFSLLCVDDT